MCSYCVQLVFLQHEQDRLMKTQIWDKTCLGATQLSVQTAHQSNCIVDCTVCVPTFAPLKAHRQVCHGVCPLTTPKTARNFTRFRGNRLKMQQQLKVVLFSQNCRKNILFNIGALTWFSHHSSKILAHLFDWFSIISQWLVSKRPDTTRH